MEIYRVLSQHGSSQHRFPHIKGHQMAPYVKSANVSFAMPTYVLELLQLKCTPILCPKSVIPLTTCQRALHSPADTQLPASQFSQQPNTLPSAA